MRQKLESLILLFSALMLVFSGPLSASAAGQTSLSQAIGTALENSRTLQDAQYSLQIANGQVREAWSNVMPVVSSSANYSRSLKKQEMFLPATFLGDTTAAEGAVVAIPIGSDNVWNASLTVTQPLFNAAAFIGVGASSRVQRLQQEMVRGIAQQVVTNIRQAYLNALLASEQVRLTQKSLERINRSLQEATAMHEQGLVSDYDVLRLQVQQSNLEATLHQSQVAANATRRSLLLQMGQSAQDDIVLSGQLSEMNIHQPAENSPQNAALLKNAGMLLADNVTADDLFLTAGNRRSDMRQANISVGLRQAQLSAQRSQYYPILSLYFNLNYTVQEDGSPDYFSSTRFERSTYEAAGINFSLPLFTGFARSARMQQRRAALRQSQLRYRFSEEAANVELTTLLETALDSRRRADSQAKALTQAHRGFEIVTAQYRNGISSQIQVIDAEVALRQTEFNYARSVYDYLIARSQLDFATGLTPITIEELHN